MNKVASKNGLTLVISLVALVAGVLLTFGAMKVLPGLSPLESSSESRNTTVINAIERKEQVVLLSLGIQGISEKVEGSKFLGVSIPGSARASFLQYVFHAKLGIEGKDVTIQQTGANGYRVFIPEFKFIGHDDVTFRLVAENNGVLSWVTPQIDTVEMVNSILSDDAQEQYVASNEMILKDQAKAFYAGIIRSVDPAAEVTLDFLK